MVTKQDVAVFKGELDKMGNEFGKVLPKAIPSEKFMRSVMTTIQLNPGIVSADHRSIIACCMKAAADGLILDGREAALVVYRGKAGPVANYLPMVAGIIKKVRQSGDVALFNATVVHDKDDFEITYGLKPDIQHKPPVKGDRGKAIGCYAVAQFKDSTVDFEYMTYEEIEGIRSRSKAKNAGPWVTDWTEMARKTVMRRLSKRMPMSTDAMGTMQRIDELYDLDGGPDAAPRKKSGAGAAALNPETLETDPDTGAPIIDVTAEEVTTTVGPKTKEPKQTAKQKRAEKLRAELAKIEEEEGDDGDDNKQEDEEETENPNPQSEEAGEEGGDSEEPEEDAI